jgi:uncharacterized protein
MMFSGEAAQLLRIHLTEGRAFQGRPLHEAILDRCRAMGIAGASVFRGLEGFGETAEVHRHRTLSRDQPLSIVIVDEPARISRLIPELESMMDSGVIAISDVKARRVTRDKPGQA